ncbi:MAG: glycosyltransferase family 2 protein [Ignavibacteriales bacterium]|nr:glycosyltransferase family 2 protein [Ignavibacteriales bacterium]
MDRHFNKGVDVSVIIVNYNSTYCLVNCIASVMKYTEGVNYEIIVVDNNSTDNIQKIFFEKFPLVKVIKNNENRGFGAANNQGAEMARGRFLLLLNNDTLFVENSIFKICDFYLKSKGNLLIGCKLVTNNGSVQRSFYPFPHPWNLITSNLFLYKIFPRSKLMNKSYLFTKEIKEIKEVDVIVGAFMFLQRDLFIELGGFDENFFFYHEDTDLCFRFVQSGGRVLYFPQTHIIHLGGGTTDKYPWFRYKNKSVSVIKFAQKHFTGPKFILSVFVHYLGLMLRVPVYFLYAILTLNKSMFLKSFIYFRCLFLYPSNSFRKND